MCVCARALHRISICSLLSSPPAVAAGVLCGLVPPKARQLLRELPALVDINIPDDAHFTVCGDVHGQFYDLLNIWELNGMPGPSNPYLFNGEPSQDGAAAATACCAAVLCCCVHALFFLEVLVVNVGSNPVCAVLCVTGAVNTGNICDCVILVLVLLCGCYWCYQ